MAAPLNACTTIEQRGVVRFLWEKIWKQRISTKKYCPCTVNIACHVKQSSKTRSFGGTLSWRWCGWKSSARMVPTATKRILRRRFETVGQVLKFVWRLCWKINVVCMSLSPFDFFQSRFVTYLLNRPCISNPCYVLCLQLHTVGSQFFSHSFKFIIWLALVESDGVRIATSLRAGQSRVQIPAGAGEFCHPQKLPGWLWCPPNVIFNVYWGTYPGIKWPGCDADHSHSGKVKNVWSCTSAAPMWLHGAHRNSLIFTW